MSWRRWLALPFGLAIGAVAVVLVARDDAARHAIQGIALGTLALVLVLQVVNVISDSIRYRMVLPSRYQPLIGRWLWHRIFAVGRLLNTLVPQGGMAYRAAHLKIVLGIPLAAFFGSVAVISWLGNGLVMVLVGAFVMVAGRPGVGATVLILGAVILTLIALVPRMVRSESSSVRRLLPARFGAVFESFGESFVELIHGDGRLRPVLAMSLLTQAAGVAAFVTVCAAIGLDSPFVVGAVLYAATTVMTVISLTPASIGIFELAAGLGGGLMDIGAPTGILVALVIRVTGLVSVALLAVTAIALERSDGSGGAAATAT